MINIKKVKYQLIILFFVTNVIDLYGQDDYIVNHSKFMQKTNPSYLIKTWYTKISDPYLAYIKNKNQDFFMNKDYSTELQDEVKKEVNINSITEQCKIIFNTINDEEKEIIWKYLKILSELSSLYITNIST